jgi:hypothetical protein
MCKVSDPLFQHIHRENIERMNLARFVASLAGVPGKQVRYANPQTMQQALTIVLSAQEAEKQERFNEIFYKKFGKSFRLTTRSPSRTSGKRPSPGSSANTHASSRKRGQHRKPLNNARKSLASETTRNYQTKAALKCYECEGVGHFARECPRRLKKEENLSNATGRRNLS